MRHVPMIEFFVYFVAAEYVFIAEFFSGNLKLFATVAAHVFITCSLAVASNLRVT